MVYKHITNKFRKENRGSTIITVVVAIAFVTILTTIILGTTVVNVRMKGIDKMTKDDFYYAEKALYDIYTGIGEELTVSAGDIYETAFNKIAKTDDHGKIIFEHAEEAESEFRSKFLEKAYSYLNAEKSKLGEFITDKGTVDSVGDVEYQTVNGKRCSLSDTGVYRVAIRNVQVSVEEEGFRSVITTDIIVNVPTVDFLGTNADISDYGIIANKGLYIEGNATINGNVYAGVRTEAGDYPSSTDKDYAFYESSDKSSKEKVFGGINVKDGTAVFEGNYIVSKGDINLGGLSPRLEVLSPAASDDTNLTNLWYTSLRTVSTASLPELLEDELPADAAPTIDINANVYALNDLALNADNSRVRIKGNYYGYNDKTLLAAAAAAATPDTIYSDSNMFAVKTGREDGVSSAIIVNGSGAYLNMHDINNFVLMGKAYIDFTSDDETNAGATVTQIVPTAESVALKTNQQLYLVPPDFLEGSNPEENGSGNFVIDPANIRNWFGLKYLNYGTDINNPDVTDTGIHKPYKVTYNDGSYVWFDYLVFNDKSWKPDGTGGYTESGDPLGTGGSISSKTKFFYDIMNWKADYQREFDALPESERSRYADLNAYINERENAPDTVQPTAKRMFERIDRSMNWDYFDLKECVIGDKDHLDKANIYAKNAVINYYRNDPDDMTSPIMSNVLNNTHGMFRYSSYPQNLFRRYMWLCTELDAKEDFLIDSNPGEPSSTNVEDWKDLSKNAPMSYFVNIGNLGNMTTLNTDLSNASGDLNPLAFGVCIAGTPSNADHTFEISKTNTELPDFTITADTFKGIAIINGNITVAQDIKVEGLLMATGTITLEGNNEIRYDRGLIQSRIEKEMSVIKNESYASFADAISDKRCYLIRYLTKKDGSYLYSVIPGSKITRDRIEADYNDFIHYENWQKGQK